MTRARLCRAERCDNPKRVRRDGGITAHLTVDRETGQWIRCPGTDCLPTHIYGEP